MVKRTRLLVRGSLCFLLASPLWADKPHPWQIGFQNSASPVMDKITSLHDLLLLIIFSIATFVALLLLITIFRFRASRNPTPSTTSHNTFLEIFWTLIPVLILSIIAVPSFKLLHYMDKTKHAELTLKAVGHQWFWEYDYPEHNINFNSYLVPADQLKPGDLRLLETDQAVVLPVETNIKILVTSTDVIHSWALPAYGIKQDAIPGRLRETWVRINKVGTYFGQCSELCGQGHAFMPIKVQAVTKADFQNWISSHKQKSESKTENTKQPAPEKK